MHTYAILVIKYIVVLFTYSLYVCCFHYVFKKSIKINKYELALGIILVLFYYYFNRFFPKYIDYVITFPITFLIIDSFYEKERKKKILFTFLLGLLSMILDTILSFVILSGITAIPNSYENSEILLSILLHLVVSIICFLIVDYKNIKRQIAVITGISENFSLILTFLFLGIIMVFIISILNINLSFSKVLIGFCLVCLFTLVIIIMRLETSKKSLNMLLKMYSNKNEFYMKVSEESKILRHNIINILAGLRTTNDNNLDLINDRVKQYSNDIVWLNNIEYAPSSIKGYLLEKLYPYQDQGLKLKIINNCNEDIMMLLGVKKFNALCEAIGVNLDNAINACLKTNEKILVIDFSYFKNELIVKTINSFDGDIDLDSLGDKNYTTKKSGHGYGLYSILKNRKIKTNITINNDWFCVEMRMEFSKTVNYK